MHWCLGMPASGSTWVFNAALKVGAALFPDRRIVSGYVAGAADIQTSMDSDTVTILKSHDMDDDAALQMSLAADVIWLSIRDPRDCITSWMVYQDHSFEEALEVVAAGAAFCRLFASDPRSRLLRYEDGFIEDITTLDHISSGFGAVLSRDVRTGIFEETRRSAIEKHISQIGTLPTALRLPDPGHIVDTATQWHTHHANRDGEIGRWRRVLT